MTLIQEKVAQAIGLLRELDIPCWLTFVRETGITSDPVLPFLVQAHLTWPSALIVTADGDTHAIVGRYDRQMVEETGAWCLRSSELAAEPRAEHSPACSMPGIDRHTARCRAVCGVVSLS